MNSVNVYLNFNGNTEEAFNFYKSVFGGEFEMLQRFSDTPQADNVKPEEKNGIMHIALKVGNLKLMGTDTTEARGRTNFDGNITLFIDTKSEEDTDKILAALSEGGKITMPLQKTFWNAYFGMVKDRFGVTWMLNYDFNK